VSEKKGTKKRNIPRARLVVDHGIDGDAHAGSGRQVSLLPIESFAKLDSTLVQLYPGVFAENLTTTGLDFTGVEVGRKLRVGKTAELEITQIGKECHHGCYIRQLVGDCIMPREGIFARVLKGGEIQVGDSLELE
jgi:MOSC domain-containing protein YiiM